MHYQRWYNGKPLDYGSDACCRTCNVALPPKKRHGPVASYCGAACKPRLSPAAEARARARRRAVSAERLAGSAKKCPQCRVEFTPRYTVRQVYCSTACGTKYRVQHRQVDACGEDGCGRLVRARGMCGMHYRRWERANGRVRPDPWNDRRRAGYHLRRAQKKGAAVGDGFLPGEVFERDGWVCGLCGEDVPRDAQHPDPMSASVDHVVPLSRGGAHSIENVQCAHLRCNVRKGANMTNAA